MPEIIETTVYRFDELSEPAKARAREWYIDNVLNNGLQWYEPVFEDFQEICKTLGITLRSRPTRRNEPAETSTASPCIWFRGFSSQGDGASFEGTWEHEPTSCQQLRDHAPKDERLHEIAETLASAQKENAYQLQATITQSGMYYHEYSMQVDIEMDSDVDAEASEGTEETVTQALRDLARWLYRSLEDTYVHETSDTTADETLLANSWRFTASGAFYTLLQRVTRPVHGNNA